MTGHARPSRAAMSLVGLLAAILLIAAGWIWGDLIVFSFGTFIAGFIGAKDGRDALYGGGRRGHD